MFAGAWVSPTNLHLGQTAGEDGLGGQPKGWMKHRMDPLNHSDPCNFCCFTQEFHDQLIEFMAEMRSIYATILQRLEKINGSVGELYRTSNDHAQRIAVIDATGTKGLTSLRERVDGGLESLRERVEGIHDALQSGDHFGSKKLWTEVASIRQVMLGEREGKRATREILSILKPAIWMLFSAIMLVVFEHRDVIARALGLSSLPK